MKKFKNKNNEVVAKIRDEDTGEIVEITQKELDKSLNKWLPRIIEFQCELNIGLEKEKLYSTEEALKFAVDADGSFMYFLDETGYKYDFSLKDAFVLAFLYQSKENFHLKYHYTYKEEVR